MLLSGPKSYYDDYVRKRDTSRTLNDPPSLLTDRGAYVNFLEVQLERVSAACLGVQSYDQRFNDMQSLIVSLEQRCASNTRLVGLAQQCTEELRNQTEERIDKISENFKQEHWEIRNLVETMSMRIASVEQALAGLPVMERRQDEADTRISRSEAELESTRGTIDSNHTHLLGVMEQFESNHQRVVGSVGALQTATSKLQFDLDENMATLKGAIASSESRMLEAIEEKSEHSARGIHLATVKATEAVDKLQRDVVSREAGCLAAVRLLGESLREEAEVLRDRCEENLSKLEEKFNEDVEAEVTKLNKRIKEHIAIIQDDVETQKRLHTSFVQSSKQQLKQLDRAIGSISQEQEEIYKSTCDLHQTLSSQQLSPVGRQVAARTDGSGPSVSFQSSPPSVYRYPTETDSPYSPIGDSSSPARLSAPGQTSISRQGSEENKHKGEDGEEGPVAPVHADKAITSCRERAQHRLKTHTQSSPHLLAPQYQQYMATDPSSHCPSPHYPSSMQGWGDARVTLGGDVHSQYPSPTLHGAHPQHHQHHNQHHFAHDGPHGPATQNPQYGPSPAGKDTYASHPAQFSPHTSQVQSLHSEHTASQYVPAGLQPPILQGQSGRYQPPIPPHYAPSSASMTLDRGQSSVQQQEQEQQKAGRGSGHSTSSLTHEQYIQQSVQQHHGLQDSHSYGHVLAQERLPEEENSVSCRRDDDRPVRSGYTQEIPSRTADLSTIEVADDESVNSLGVNAKLRSTVTTRSPSSKNDDSSRGSRTSSKEYIDYVGGGLYCNTKKKENDLGNSRAAALGLSYIGTGLYVDPQEVKRGYATARDGESREMMSSEKKRKSSGGAAVSGERRSVSPGRRAPLPPRPRPHSTDVPGEVGEGEGGEESDSMQLRASTEAFERFLQKYQGAAGTGQDDDGSLSSRSVKVPDGQSPPDDVFTEYMEFKQQQQVLPWHPPPHLARPLRQPFSHTRCTKILSKSTPSSVTTPASTTPSHHADMSISFDDASTIMTSSPSHRSSSASRHLSATAAVDKVAPEKRHFLVPQEKFHGAGAMLQTK